MREDLRFPDRRFFTGLQESLPTHSLTEDDLGCVESRGLAWLATLGRQWRASHSPHHEAGRSLGRESAGQGWGRPDPLLIEPISDRPDPLLSTSTSHSGTTDTAPVGDQDNLDATSLVTPDPITPDPTTPDPVTPDPVTPDPIATERQTEEVEMIGARVLIDPVTVVDLTPPSPTLDSGTTLITVSDPLGPLNTTTSPGVHFSDLVFSRNEGSAGTVQIRLTQAPTTPVTLTLSPGDFLVVDADNNLQNGAQTTLTFTAADWNQARTIGFIAEVDGVATDRTAGNAIAYTLSGGATGTGTYDLGVITNTYAPDPTRFNIDLDFRNDTTGFWTPQRQAIAQQAANDWAVRIANEWDGLQLDAAIGQLGNDGGYTNQTFNTKRYVDDLVVFVNTIDTNGTAGGYGIVEYDFGGWISSPSLQPRVGQIAIDPIVGDFYLYNAVLHELGHTLGLVGLNWDGFLQQNLSTPQTATFNGLYTQAANGGVPMPLQSQDGANPVTGDYDYWHPANSVYSVMSYGWLYSVTAPTAIDFAMLADSGYQVYGVNVPALTTVPDPVAIAV